MPRKTNEFSICLQPTADIAERIDDLRMLLPASPYRDDPPHITLIRGMVSDGDIGDNELLSRVATISQIGDKLPLSGTITDVINKSNHFYSESSVLIISPSDELLLFRSNLQKLLVSDDFSDESHDNNTHDLHITIRLGIPIVGDLLQDVKDQFLKKTVQFIDWSIFRLELEDGDRKMREIKSRDK